MVHEWWGITKHMHDSAQKLAQQGYTAFIADMYGDARTADNPKDAGALATSVMKDPKVMEGRFNAAQAQLSKHASVDPPGSPRSATASAARSSSTWRARARIWTQSRASTPRSASTRPRPRRARSRPRSSSSTARTIPSSRRRSTPHSGRRWRPRRPTTASSNTPARCTPSQTRKPPNSARSSTCPCATTPRWTRRRGRGVQVLRRRFRK